MLPKSEQRRSLGTAVAGIPSKNWAFTLKTWLNELTEVGYLIFCQFLAFDFALKNNCN